MTWRDHIRKVVDSRRFQNLIIAIIVINAITLGLETSPQLVERHGDILHALDRIALWIFVAELTAGCTPTGRGSSAIRGAASTC